MSDDEKMIPVPQFDQLIGLRVDGDLGFAEEYAMKAQLRASSIVFLPLRSALVEQSLYFDDGHQFRSAGAPAQQFCFFVSVCKSIA